MNAVLLHTERELIEKGFRITPPRRTILKVLSSHPNRHVTADQIYRIARAQGLKLGLATVYRALMDLEKLGFVVKIEIGKGPAQYELASAHIQPHYHLVCLGCGRIFEVTAPIPEDFCKAIAQGQNFEISGHSIEVFGYCEACRSKQQRKKPPERLEYPKNLQRRQKHD